MGHLIKAHMYERYSGDNTNTFSVNKVAKTNAYVAMRGAYYHLKKNMQQYL